MTDTPTFDPALPPPRRDPRAHDARTHDAGLVRLCGARRGMVSDAGVDLAAFAPDLLDALHGMLALYAHISDDVLDRTACGTQHAAILTRDACLAILAARRLVRFMGVEA